MKLIFISVEKGYLEILKLLDELYPNWYYSYNQYCIYDNPTLIIAVKKGYLEIAKFLLKKSLFINININAFEKRSIWFGGYGDTALLLAVKNNDLEMIKLLLKEKNISIKKELIYARRKANIYRNIIVVISLILLGFGFIYFQIMPIMIVLVIGVI